MRITETEIEYFYAQSKKRVEASGEVFTHNKMVTARDYENNCNSFLQNKQSPPIHGGVSAQARETMLYHRHLN